MMTQTPTTHRHSVVVPGITSIPAAPTNPYTTALVFSILCQAVMILSLRAGLSRALSSDLAWSTAIVVADQQAPKLGE